MQESTEVSISGSVMPPFIGRDHALLVSRIFDLYASVSHLSIAKWMSIEAPTGWGKTRIIQEFYKQIAKLQAAPAYWPPSFEDAAINAHSIRKLTHPPRRVHQPKSQPQFMWIGIDCSLRNGLPGSSLPVDLRQFTEAFPDYKDARRKISATSPTAAVTKVISELGSDIGGQIAEMAAPGLPPGTAAVAGAALKAPLKIIRSTRDRRQRLERSGPIDQHDELIARIVNMVDDVCAPGLPLIVAIEDLHLADESLVQFLGKLISLQKPILILSSALPHELRQNTEIWPTIEQLWRGPLERVYHDALFAKNQTEDELFRRLDTDDLESLAAAYCPDANSVTLAAVSKRFQTPLTIQMFFDLPRIQSLFAKGLQPSQADIQLMPNSVADLYRQHWESLPPTSRRFLTLAAQATPRALNSRWGKYSTWQSALIVETVNGSLQTQTALETVRPWLEKRIPLAWCEPVEYGHYYFPEIDLFEIANSDSDLLSASDLHYFLASLSAEIHSRWGNEDTESVHVARLALALHDEGYSTNLLELAYHARTVLADLEDKPREIAARKNLALFALGNLSGIEEIAIVLKAMLAEIYRESGEFDAMRTVLHEVLEIQISKLEPTDEQVVSTRYTLAVHDESAYDGIDLQVLRELLSTQNSAGRQRNPLTLFIRTSIATSYTMRGRPEVSEELLSNLIPEVNSVLGAKNKYALVVRHELANAYLKQGKQYLAVSTLRRLVADEISFLGPGHRETIASWDNLTTAYREIGSPKRAFAIGAELLRIAEINLGIAHRDTLHVRIGLAYSLLWQSRYQESFDAFGNLLDDISGTFGEESEEFVRTVNAMHSARIYLPWEELRDDAEALHSRSISIFGANHSLSLRTGLTLSLVLRASGDVDAAIEILMGIIRLEDHHGADPVLIERAKQTAVYNIARKFVWNIGRNERLFPSDTPNWEILLRPHRLLIRAATGSIGESAALLYSWQASHIHSFRVSPTGLGMSQVSAFRRGRSMCGKFR